MNNSCSKTSTYSPTQTKRQFCPWKFFKTPPNLPFISSRLKSSNKSISPKITFPALKKNKKPCFSPISLTYPHSLPPATAACIAALPLRPPHSGSNHLQVLSLSLSLSLSLTVFPSENWNPNSKGISDFASLDLLCVLFSLFWILLITNKHTSYP